MTARTSLVRGVLRANPGRTRLMIAAIAVGVAATGAILGAFTVIDRTIAESFDSTTPATASITVEGDAREFVAQALATEGVTDAEPRREITVRLESDATEAAGTEAGPDPETPWQRLTLVSVDDLEDWRIGRAFPEDGAWPPRDGEIVIERASLTEVDLEIGDHVTAASAVGSADLAVTGLAHDPGRTPAWMFGNVVGYVTPGTLASLGLTDALPTLAITTDPANTRGQNRAIAADVQQAIEQAGGDVETVDVPVPGEHPAADVMQTLLYLLQAFGIVSLVAAAGLVATLVVAEIKRSTGTIAVMKATGATSAQVAGVYLLGLLAVTGLGLVLGIGLGMAGTWALSSFAFLLLNLEATSMIAAAWVFPVQAAVSIAVPLAAVAVPLWRLSRIPVRDYLSDFGTTPARAPRRTRTADARARALSLGTRNATRQPGRLALTVLSLAVGSAAVLTALNTGAAWDRIVADEFEANNFSVQVQLSAPVPVGSLGEAASADDAIQRLEYWNVTTAVVTGADGTVGAEAVVYAPPDDSVSATFPVVEGRALQPADARAVVITQNLTDPAIEVGDHITLEGDPDPWEVVGVIRQLSGGQDGAVFVSETPAWIEPGTAQTLRVKGPTESEALASAEALAADASVTVLGALTATDAKESLDDHLFIITGLLLVMAIGLGIVGLLALVEAMSTAVDERRREFALFKTVGADGKNITRMVTAEALAFATLAAVAAVVLAVPLTSVVESAVGVTFVGAPLPFTWWCPGVAIIVIATAGTATAASIVPGYAAADLPVRESLAHA